MLAVKIKKLVWERNPIVVLQQRAELTGAVPGGGCRLHQEMLLVLDLLAVVTVVVVWFRCAGVT